MDRRYIDDHHIVARYLANRLTDEEREAFEAYYVEHPDMVQEMEAAARFKVGLMKLRETGELTRLLQREQRPPWHYVAAAAAIAALAIGTFLLIDRTPASRPVLAASIDALHATGGVQATLTGQYAILRTRGSAVDAEIELPPAGQALELRVLPEFAARPERYRVQLFRMSADDSMQSVAELGGLAPDPDTFVSVFVDAARLQAGQYRLAIAGDPDTDARDKESAFILRMRRAVNDPSAESR
jgi:hypothetical protein